MEAAREGQKQLKEFDGASLSLPKTSKLTLPEEVDAFVEAITSRRQLSINMVCARCIILQEQQLMPKKCEKMRKMHKKSVHM